jgi:hypothetical protein
MDKVQKKQIPVIQHHRQKHLEMKDDINWGGGGGGKKT